MQVTFGASVTRACELSRLSRALYYYRSRRRDPAGLRLRIRELAQARPRFGCQRIYVLLRREGWRVNFKRVRRLYRLEGLQLRLRPRRRKHISLHRGIPPAACRAQDGWSINFVHDARGDGRPFRVLTVVDQWSRLNPILEMASSMSGRAFAEALNEPSTATVSQ